MWKYIIAISSVLVFLVAFIITTDCFVDLFLPKLPEIDSNKTWTDNDDIENDEIRSIVVRVHDDILNALNDKIKLKKLPSSFPESNFKYGFNVEYLKKLLSYWTDKYSWHDWENKINSFPHYLVTINGLQIHYIHIKPELKPKQRLVTVLLLHGWPGSFFEFYKVITMLTHLQDDAKFAFEIVCPSLPGFGWSNAATKPNFGISAISSVLLNLMERLNVSEKFFIQGGDFGSYIAGTMSKLKPNKVAGIHINMVSLPMHDLRSWLMLGIGAILPSKFHFLSEEDQNMIYPFKKKTESLLTQLAYFWFHATRPSTIGIALSDNPVGLVAYIAEKFGAWSNDLEYHLNSEHGGLEDIPISKDEILTNVMIYYITNSISSSVRLYKDMLNEDDQVYVRHPVKVPVGIALFPNEVVKCPKEFAKLYYRDIRQFTIMPKGGHFAALEQPELLVEDLKVFISNLEGIL